MTTKRIFSWDDVADIEAIAKVQGWTRANFVPTAKNRYRIDFGDGNYSHTNGVPATQLKQWIAGALSMLGVAQNTLAKAEKARKEALEDTIPEGDDLIDALHRECEANSVNVTYMTDKLWRYMDASALTQEQVKSIAEEADLHVYNEEELQEEREQTIAEAIEDHPLFRQAVRVAYARNETERQSDISELAHILAREWNAHSQAALI